jgi:2'-5' RNA ligase/endonuclease/exonuclease/phosphatase family metal-dependent hydrolase
VPLISFPSKPNSKYIIMETPEKASKPKRLAIGSYQTALCLIPHATLCRDIDRLRALYDKGYGKWPPHINIIYPFVAIEDLPEAVDLVRSNLVRFGRESGNGKIHLRLEKSGHFSHRHSDTIYIAPGDDGCSQRLEQLRSAILEDFDQHDELYHPHLTIGQSQVKDTSFRDYLLAKAALLLPIDLRVEELVVLVRERMHGQDNSLSQMKTWDTVSLFNDAPIKPKRSGNSQEKYQTEGELTDEEEMQSYGRHQTITSPLLESLQISTDSPGARKASTTQQGVTYQFSPSAAIWEPVPISPAMSGKEEMPPALVVSSYNVLVDSIHPPVRDRYALLLRALLSESAVADVLVLQEVSDDFLSYLLGQTVIRSHYPFTTHGPPDQQGIGPLTSLRNIVVLSRWSFGWEWIPFDRRHKGAVVLMFNTTGKSKDAKSVPLIVAGVHLTSGLTDSAVAAKKSQLQLLIDHLSREYAENPWVITGDFNVTTSAFTIEAALKNKSISQQTANILSSFGTMLSNARLSDSWLIARTEIGETLRPSQYQTDFDNLNEGEQGATFDPTTNALAAEARGWGSNHRPQRYDRILFKGQDFLGVTGFNMFGFPEESDSEKGDGNMEGREAAAQYGSDHWGIRATLKINSNFEERELEVVGALSTLLQPRKAPSSLSDVASLKECLGKLSTIPSDDEINKRKEAFALVKNVLQQSPIQEICETADNKKSIISMVVVPVGSYGLGVWSTSSDIDCLCIGSISAKTFFALAVQRFMKVADLGVRILRQVKASSGTMLELDIRGMKFDLQYCPATRIAERFVQFAHTIPHNVYRRKLTEVLMLKISQMARGDTTSSLRSIV